VPDHAAVDIAVRMVQADRRAARYPGLVNAVLRRIGREGAADLATASPTVDIPEWLGARWRAAYGADVCATIAAALREPPPLDVSVKQDAEDWAARLRGHVLASGTVRLAAQGAVSRLPGFDEGGWWVQDAAAALPARLLGDVAGQRVADLCAAPGGKSVQLALAGANVTAVDRSGPRMGRLQSNFARLGLTCETVVADVLSWEAEPFDAVLLDAPCLATGTIRRHPDVSWLKRESDLVSLVDVQRRLLDRAVALTRPGGRLVYSVCSLEPEEGERQTTALLERYPGLSREPIAAEEVGGWGEMLTDAGELRSLPSHLPNADPRLAGLDGFFAARLRKN
jgi:16S rRNA (cytosine967-C5)-methyltransferase